MKLALASDLHLEFGDIELKNTEMADVLVLSGDILVAQYLHEHTPESIAQSQQPLSKKQRAARTFRDFLARCSAEFPHIVYVAGNHEFYDGGFYKSIDHLRSECSQYGNVHFLENDQVQIGDVTFIGGTLWADLNRGDPVTVHTVQKSLNDFKVIRNDQRDYAKLSPADTVARHKATVKYIRDEVSKKRREKFVVVGHHAPTKRSRHPAYDDYAINGAYNSDLSEFILDHPQILLWTCGHIHHRHRYYIGATLVCCNPRGYVGHEHMTEDFELKYIDLDNLPAEDEVENDFSWDQ